MKKVLLSSLVATCMLIFANPTEAQLNVGDLVITEVFANPGDFPDADAEFFEIFNTTTSVINLNGLSFVEDDGDNEAFTVIADTFVNPGEFFVLATADGTAAGNFPVDLNFNDANVVQLIADGSVTGANGDTFGTGSFFISNGGDEILIVEGDLAGSFNTIFTYTAADNDLFGTGTSSELANISTALDGVVTAEDDFVASTTTGFFPTDFASPGVAGATAIPEPASAMLLALGVAGAGLRRRRRS